MQTDAKRCIGWFSGLEPGWGSAHITFRFRLANKTTGLLVVDKVKAEVLLVPRQKKARALNGLGEPFQANVHLVAQPVGDRFQDHGIC